MAHNLDHELRWIDEETERSHIDLIRERFASEIEGCPEDLTHDITIARCLRGHRNDPEEAAEFFIKGLRYRKEIIAIAPIAEFRAANLEAVVMDVTKLPFAKEIGRALPVRGLNGQTVDGLPIICTIASKLDFAEFAKISESDQLKTYLQCTFEQRSLVLYNLSMQQRRMVKTVDLRDLNNFSILGMIKDGRALIASVKDFISTVQDFYPEIVHQSIVYNAPPTFAKLFGLISMVMNERMKSKLLVFPPVEAQSAMVRRLSARAIFDWMEAHTQQLNVDNIKLAAGAEEFAVQWLKSGQTLKCTVTVKDNDVCFRYAFIPHEPENGSEPEVKEVSVSSESPCEENIVAPSDGVAWLCISNAHSWVKGKEVQLVME